MKEFIGTKRILATPMNRRDYNRYRDWELPANENGDDEGFLVEYLDGGTPNDLRHEGYISWSPAAQFQLAYQKLTAMNFGHAIEMLKAGEAVARAGWNGKGMYLMYAMAQPARNGLTMEKQTLLPHILMKTVTDELVPWLASQTDVLAEDWSVVSVTPQA